MTLRGSTDIKDRLFSILVYILPLASAFPFGVSLIQQFPILNLLAIPMLPLGLVYSAVPFGLGGLLIFFASPTATHALARAALTRGLRPLLAPDEEPPSKP
jgi:hypothetical protein